MKVIKAIYNFIVGDMVILVGVVITVLLLVIFHFLPFLNSLKVVSGILLVLAVVIMLFTTLSREIRVK
jgi:hypothetical protein